MLNNFNNTIRNTFIFLTVLCSFAFLNCKEQTDPHIKNISVDELQSLLKTEDIQLVDVRTPAEYQLGFIASAQNIDYFSPTFEEEISKLEKERPIILYCKSGNRSSKSAAKLSKAGFVKIYTLDGGILKWQKEGLDVVK